MRYAIAVLFLTVVAWLGWHWLKAEPGAKAEAADPVKRGAYLVNEVARCGDCHTPRDAKGRLDMNRHLQGATIWFTPKVRMKEFEDKAPNITMSGKAGSWSEERMIKYLMQGGKDGEGSDAPMPAYHMTREDATAVTAYLRSLRGAGKNEKKERDKKDTDKKEREKKKDKDD